MGVINSTPDSFSDGGSLYRSGGLDIDLAMGRARDMVAAGAAILDIGGESTRPGAAPVSPAQEMDRVLPLVERVAARAGRGDIGRYQHAAAHDRGRLAWGRAC